MLFNVFVCHKDLQSQGLQTALYYLILQNLFNIDHMSQFGEEMHGLFFLIGTFLLQKESCHTRV